MAGCIYSVFRSGVRIPCEQLCFNLLVLKRNICLITRTRADGGLMLEKGKQVAQSYVSFLQIPCGLCEAIHS